MGFVKRPELEGPSRSPVHHDHVVPKTWPEKDEDFASFRLVKVTVDAFR
jgi:hypothetical protein